VEKPEGKRPLERPRRRWKDGMKTDHRETSEESVVCVYLAQDRDMWRAVVNTVMYLRVLATRN
jgi:hypothetical protein